MANNWLVMINQWLSFQETLFGYGSWCTVRLPDAVRPHVLPRKTWPQQLNQHTWFIVLPAYWGMGGIQSGDSNPWNGSPLATIIPPVGHPQDPQAHIEQLTLTIQLEVARALLAHAMVHASSHSTASGLSLVCIRMWVVKNPVCHRTSY